jgi:hypothetical protein
LGETKIAGFASAVGTASPLSIRALVAARELMVAARLRAACMAAGLVVIEVMVRNAWGRLGCRIG